MLLYTQLLLNLLLYIGHKSLLLNLGFMVILIAFNDLYFFLRGVILLLSSLLLSEEENLKGQLDMSYWSLPKFCLLFSGKYYHTEVHILNLKKLKISIRAMKWSLYTSCEYNRIIMSHNFVKTWLPVPNYKPHQ